MPRYFSRKQKIGLALALIVEIDENEDKSRKREMWSKKWFLQRRKFTHVRLLKELNSVDFRNFLRMDEESYKFLLEKIRPFVERQNTVMREAVSCEKRLFATLRFLATGRSYEDLKFSVAFSPQLLSRIIPETCKAIFKCLKYCMQIPSSEAEWEAIAASFHIKWNFSHCMGAMDEKHIAIQKPNGSGSLFYNYKHFFSVILFALVDADYQFMYVNVGTNGSVSDGSVLKNSSFYNKMVCEELGLPNAHPLPGTDTFVPPVFVGDSAFALSKHVMKPFPQKNITPDKRIFNYRLSRARRVVENAFDILSSSNNLPIPTDRCRPTLTGQFRPTPNKADWKQAPARSFHLRYVRQRESVRSTRRARGFYREWT